MFVALNEFYPTLVSLEQGMRKQLFRQGEIAYYSDELKMLIIRLRFT